ncbi:DinB family protein [Mucilaginibacter glaciei]|uniref:DinB family protein n=1 Tax=Mucilaginibacter glaciei TaxID=2772109 RepID=A0A926NL34_9SPHI|nr:DinB family protein [Mucilaginibacter glaciei]MBD1394064.1 DinB family protein [Mucilaginibacter glaciei]
MNVARERRSIEEALDIYREWLDTITDEQFTQTPSMGGWSYAEVYDHIMKASLGSTIALERCTHNNCPPTKKGVTLAGWYLLLMQSFPPFKTEVPESVAAKMAPKKIDKEEAKNLIIKTRKRIEAIAGLVADAPKNARWQHPRMGMLNANQWFKFIRIHLQHHLDQLNRIKKKFV